jgi:uncharacterized protein (TIGR01777 family)
MKEKNILITGGTGFIGGYLSEELLKEGHFLTVITRSPEKYKSVSAKNQKFITMDQVAERMPDMDIVINLAGESIFGQRWTDEVKNRIYESRINTTRSLVEAMEASEERPDLFISASAVGIYGDSGDELLDEESSFGSDFLATVCVDWEKESKKAEALGVRVANPRIGIVLEKGGGVIEQMSTPFKLFVGGPVGSGDQYVPWVHMKDLCNAILFPIKNENFSGPYNACAPNPATMNELAKALGSVMNRPSVFKVPEFLLNIVLGEAAEPILASLRVQPKVLQKANFEFEFEDLETALGDIM